jgi:hypothetical protein
MIDSELLVEPAAAKRRTFEVEAMVRQGRVLRGADCFK